MDWLEHEYLIPVIIGRGKEVFKVAEKIYRRTGIRAHIFSRDFSFFQRLRFECHVVSPYREEFLEDSLLSFSRSLRDYYFPVIITCTLEGRAFVEKHADSVGAAYVITDSKDLF